MNIPFIKKNKTALSTVSDNPAQLPPSLKVVFLVILAIKIVSAIMAWWWHDPWGLGFAVPLIFMVGYIGYGGYAVWNKRRNVQTVYGDSCYYLGFVFINPALI